MLLLPAIVLLAIVVTLVVTRMTTTASGPSLEVGVPDSAKVGEPIQLSLTVRNANGIGGYETKVAFDTNRANLRSFEQQPQSLRKLGRDAQPLGPVEVSDGVVIGAYSCPVADCTEATSKLRADRGARGTVQLATVTLIADSPGDLTVSLVNPIFVDASGQTVDVETGTLTFTIPVAE
jgi:hypothetical protein